MMHGRMKRKTFGPMWVSHNKVLVGNGYGGSKRPHARNPNFESEETRVLIQIWGDPLVQRTLVTTHKKHPVITQIANKMKTYGYNRSSEEINTRIKNLKCLYNRIKKDLEQGVLTEPTWKHYGAMDEIMSRPIFGNSNKVSQPPLVKQQSVEKPSSTQVAAKSTVNPQTTESDPEEQFVKIKEEKEDDDAELIDDGSEEMEVHELRPEDLLRVEEEVDYQNDMIKEEPMELFEIEDNR